MENIGKAHNESFGIFIYNDTMDNLLDFLTEIVKRQIRMSLLIISEPWIVERTNLIKKHLSDLQATAFFYLAISAGSLKKLCWHQVISLKSGSSITNLKFEKNTWKIIETYDLQGLQITSTSLTWAPYLTIDECNDDGLNCAKNHGYIIDFMDNLATTFNFTYLSQKNVYNEWYKLGVDGGNGTVLGDVMYKHYDMSLSPWLRTESRDKLFDMVPFIHNRLIMAWRPQQSKIDFGLFTRAFLGDTWAPLLCFESIMLIIFFFAHIYGLDNMMDGMKMLNFIWWLFFVLVHSYYCGVMTMLFAVPPSAPFETMSDVLQAYPKWKLIFMDGGQHLLQSFAQQGDEDYMTLWERYEDNPTETTYSSIENGLQLIEEGQNVMRIMQNNLLGHLKSNPSKQKYHIVQIGKIEFSHLLLHKNSPLLPIFNLGASHIRESGLERELYHKWFGDFEQHSGYSPTEGNILTLGHMVTVFLMMLVAFVIALLVLGGELTFKQLPSLMRLTWYK